MCMTNKANYKLDYIKIVDNNNLYSHYHYTVDSNKDYTDMHIYLKVITSLLLILWQTTASNLSKHCNQI